MAFLQPPEPPEDIPIEAPGSTATQHVEPDEATAESPRAVRQWANDFYLVAVMVAVFIVDQVSKQLVRDNIAEGSSVPSDGFFRLTHVSNTGSAFGFFPSQTAILALASLVGIVILIIFYRRQGIPSRWLHTSLGPQLGGAAGNLADRITMGSVTDFVDIGRWPVFNVADASIVVGLGVLGWVLWFRTREPGTEQESQESKEEETPQETAAQDEVEETRLSLVCETSDERLDSFIAGVRPEFSRSQVQRLVRGDRVLVNGVIAKASLRLQPGDKVELFLPPPEPSHPVPEDIAVTILYRDDDILVIDKPPGLSVHPAPGHPGGTLVNALLARYPDLQEIGDQLRPGIVHRLDADTSGVIVVARTERAYRDLSGQFKEHSPTKVYQALVLGHPEPPEGIIEAPLARDTRNRKRMAIAEEGRQATTRYRTMERYDGYTLLEVAPQTGRTHQIRVHLSSIGYPVAGDRLYGGRTALLQRQFLHAAKLGVRLPSSGEYAEFVSPLPPDLAETLASLAPYTS